MTEQEILASAVRDTMLVRLNIIQDQMVQLVEHIKEDPQREEDQKLWRDATIRQEMYNAKILDKLDRMIDLLQLIYESNAD
jgi:hypothetical protein